MTEVTSQFREAVVEFDPETLRKFGIEAVFEKVQFIDSKLVLSIDLEQGVKILLSDIKTGPSYAPEEEAGFPRESSRSTS